MYILLTTDIYGAITQTSRAHTIKDNNSYAIAQDLTETISLLYIVAAVISYCIMQLHSGINTQRRMSFVHNLFLNGKNVAQILC